jgi:gliding motility-associated-like protein/uncharacterized repeat protein (TIGR01451 family)
VKHLCRIIVICGLLVIKYAGYSQTLTGQNGYPTYTINEGTAIVLHAAASNAAAYQWSKNGMKISGATSKDYTANSAGIYTAMAFNFEGCPSELSDGVNIIVVPPTQTTKPDTAVDLMISIASTNIYASPGDNYNYILTANNNSPITGTQVQVSYVVPPTLEYVPQPTDAGVVTYNNTTRTLTWGLGALTQDNPVKLTVDVKVLQPGVVESVVNIKGKQPDPILANNIAQVVQQVNPLVVPNVFTPNGDGKNDTFFIPGLDTYSSTELTIINRWGNTVYQKINYQNDWTGSGLVEGTYFYVLRAKTTAGVWDVYKGYLTLLRTKL